MADDRRIGRGLYTNDWSGKLTEIEELLTGIVDWCRSVLGQTRKPYGVDAFDLALAWQPAGAPDVSSTRFLRLSVADLYEEGFRDELRSLFAACEPRSVSAGIFSWGDAAHRALPSERSR